MKEDALNDIFANAEDHEEEEDIGEYHEIIHEQIQTLKYDLKKLLED